MLRPCAKRKGGGRFCGRAPAYSVQNAAIQVPPTIILAEIEKLRPGAKGKGGGTFCGRAPAYTAQNAAVQAPPGLDSEIWPTLPKAVVSN